MSSNELEELRKRIDAIDDQLLELLNKRTKCVIQIGAVKAKETDAEEMTVFRPKREAQILRRMRERNDGPLSASQIELIFREVISMSIAFQRPISIAYLGPAGTYSHSAVVKQFGRSTTVRAQASILDVFHAVEADITNFGVVPVENSTEGAVNLTLDCFIESGLRVCGEINLSIHHAFLTKRGVDLKSIEKIYSHEQSFAQCRAWLRKHFPDVPVQALASNAEAARMAEEEAGTAAIAGELAADQFHLDIIYSKIEDQVSNATRFFVLGKQTVPQCGLDKTSLLVYAPNRSGALVDLLSPFQRHGISLTRLVSRPGRTGSWSYVFFIDFDGHEDDEAVANVLDEVREVAYDLKILGSYPRAFDS